MSKSIDTLVTDCEDLFTTNTELPDELLDWAAQEFRQVLKSRFSSYGDTRDSSGLRMSQVGKDLRLLYLEDKEKYKQNFRPHMLRLFLYGDLLEILMVVMAEAAGHPVTRMQEEVTLEGIKGHIDGVIDGHLVDFKSASGVGFKKFANGSIKLGDDPYGYIGQLAAYAQSDQMKDEVQGRMAFVALDKEKGHLTVLKVPDMYTEDMSTKITNIKSVRQTDNIPPMCKDSEPIKVSKTSNNMKIGKACTFCPFKWDCWSDSNDGQGIRAFRYSNRTEYLCEVDTEPRVDEVTHELQR